MNKELMMKVMRASISEVLEKMFFQPLDFLDAKGPGDLWDPKASDLIGIHLDFEGPFSGSLLLCLPRDYGAGLSADFMGTDKDAVTLEHVEQTAKEILNMIAGSAFANLDETAVFNLGIPEIRPAEELWDPPGNPENGFFIGVQTIDSTLGIRFVQE